MPLIDCLECGAPVSTSAESCPHCGAPPRAAAQPSRAAPERVDPGRSGDGRARAEDLPGPPPPPPSEPKAAGGSCLGTAVALLLLVAVVVATVWLWLRVPAAPPVLPLPRFEVVSATGDDLCSGLLDYCTQVHCTVANTGMVGGTAKISATLLGQDGGDIVKTAEASVPSGGQRTVTLKFHEATLFGPQSRFRCEAALMPVINAP